MRRLALAISLIACSKPAPPPTPPPAPPNQCERVADHLLSLLTDTARDAPVEELDRVRAGFATRCRDDRWSPTAQECFLSLAAKADVDRCAARLTDAQREALR